MMRSMKTACAHNDVSGRTLQDDIKKLRKGGPSKQVKTMTSTSAQVNIMMSKSMKSAGQHYAIDQAAPPKPSRTHQEIPNRQAIQADEHDEADNVPRGTWY